MRALALVVLILAAAGCSDTAERDLSTSHSEERRDFDRRIERELEEGGSRRVRALARNRRFLDSLPVFPGAELVAESHNPESGELDTATEELEYHVYASGKLSLEQYTLIDALDWGTFRFYRLPARASTSEAHRYYRRLFRGWAHRAREHGTNVGGVQFFADNYWRAGTCAWVHIGFPEHADISEARTLVVATDGRPRAECV